MTPLTPEDEQAAIELAKHIHRRFEEQKTFPGGRSTEPQYTATPEEGDTVSREREWRQWQVQFKDAKNRTYHEWKCDEDMADLYVEFLHNQTVLGPMHDIRKQHSDDDGKSWVDADTPSDKEPKA